MRWYFGLVFIQDSAASFIIDMVALAMAQFAVTTALASIVLSLLWSAGLRLMGQAYCAPVERLASSALRLYALAELPSESALLVPRIWPGRTSV